MISKKSLKLTIARVSQLPDLEIPILELEQSVIFPLRGTIVEFLLYFCPILPPLFREQKRAI